MSIPHLRPVPVVPNPERSVMADAAAVEQAVETITETPAQRMWPLPLVCEYLDGESWRLRFEFAYISPSKQFPSVTLPAGTETDFASIPRFFWRAMHPTHRHIGKASVVHDFYYRSPWVHVSREQADQSLRAGMEVLGASAWKRQAVYWAVRVGGRRAFQSRRVA